MLMSSTTRPDVWQDLDAGDDGEGSDHEGVQTCHQGPLHQGDGREVAGQEETISRDKMEHFILFPYYKKQVRFFSPYFYFSTKNNP